jgi:hypothetical protein
MEQKSLGQQAAEWIAFRRLLRERAEGESTILLHKTAVDPSCLAEPLRSEVMRKLGLEVKGKRPFRYCLILDLPD